MCTKWFSDGDVHAYFSPYQSPYDAYIAFMNALSDLQLRVNHALVAEAERARLRAEQTTAVKKREAVSTAPAPATATVVPERVRFPLIAAVIDFIQRQWGKLPWRKFFTVHKED